MRSAAACLPRLSPPAASPARQRRDQALGERQAGVRDEGCAVASITCGPASMLPATLKSSPHVWPHQSMHCVAGVRGAAAAARRSGAAGAARGRRRRCDQRRRRPRRGVAPRASSVERRPARTADSSAPASRRAPTPRARVDAQRADGEEAAGDGDAEAAVGVARDDRPGHVWMQSERGAARRAHREGVFAGQARASG